MMGKVAWTGEKNKLATEIYSLEIDECDQVLMPFNDDILIFNYYGGLACKLMVRTTGF